MKNVNFHVIPMLGMAVMSFSACDGIFSGIYDSYTIGISELSDSLIIDATEYAKWTYVNLETKETVATRIVDEAGTEEPWEDGGSMPDEWDIAIHRYDVKTNGGAVLETSYTSIDDIISSGTIPEGNYVEDTADSISIDMSNMMSGEIGYAAANINTEMAKWLDVDTSSMPPVYTLSDYVYVVRLQDDTYAAIKFLSRNYGGTSGIIMFEYVYPLEDAFN